MATKRIIIFTAAFFLFALKPKAISVKQKTEIVFCLDLSGSTDGLLNDIRDNLWQFVNDARTSMPEQTVRVAVVGFGRPSFRKENDYVKVLCDMTDNYDAVSNTLFQLKINIEKGDQCDGSALRASLNDIHWSNDAKTKRMIYLFGNGSVKTGGFDYRKACDIAVKKNIPVNAIYSVQGSIAQKDLTGWKEIATTTGGDFYTYLISKRMPEARLSTNAKWLDDMNQKLNDTYMYFTKEGKQRYELMCAADADSKKMSERFFYSRCYYKISNHYEGQYSQWDLVSMMKNNPPDFSTLNKDYLPEKYKNTSTEDLKKVALSNKDKRQYLMTQMRNAFINFQKDSTLVNPMDSIFSSGIARI